MFVCLDDTVHCLLYENLVRLVSHIAFGCRKKRRNGRGGGHPDETPKTRSPVSTGVAR